MVQSRSGLIRIVRPRYAFNIEPPILKHVIQGAPGEGTEGSAALQRYVDPLSTGLISHDDHLTSHQSRTGAILDHWSCRVSGLDLLSRPSGSSFVFDCTNERREYGPARATGNHL